MCAPARQPKGDAKVQEHLEDPAKVLFLLHQVLRLRIGAVGRIVKNFPEKRNKYLSSCYRVYLLTGIVQGEAFIGHKATKTSLFLFVESRGAKHLAIGNWE